VSIDAAVVARLRAGGCVHAEDEARLLLSTARTSVELETMLQQRLTGVPLEHVVGFAEFCGLRITVAAGVFVPRRRTEFLVAQAALLAPPAPVIVDLCCGSGAVAAALAAAATVHPAELYACDLDAVAVQCAKWNLRAVGGQVVLGDLFEPLPAQLRGRVDLLVASPPYVPTGAVGLLPSEARLHEPRHALDGGADGLDVHRRVLGEACTWLASGGHVLIECSGQQAPLLKDEFLRNGLVPTVASSEEFAATVVIGVVRP
jgi:release factor glutamine methyltransferase